MVGSQTILEKIDLKQNDFENSYPDSTFTIATSRNRRFAAGEELRLPVLHIKWLHLHIDRQSLFANSETARLFCDLFL